MVNVLQNLIYVSWKSYIAFDTPMGDHSGDHDQELPKSIEVQKVLETLRDYITGLDCYYRSKPALVVSLLHCLPNVWVT